MPVSTVPVTGTSCSSQARQEPRKLSSPGGRVLFAAGLRRYTVAVPERPLIELTYYETYYFANAVKNVLEHQMRYLRNLDDFYGDDKYLGLTPAFGKFSAFHAFIEFLIDDIMSDDVNQVKLDIRQDDLVKFANIPSAFVFDTHPSKLPVNIALDRYGLEHQSFEDWLKEKGTAFLDADNDDMHEYYSSLREDGTWYELLDRATHEVFFVLFQNRNVLLLFNDMIADQVKCAEDLAEQGDYAEYFARPGVLKRVAIPEWVQRAVYFRDRGLCVLCRRDLTGIVNIWSEENFDHIVPLASGGLNDVSNIQLLCRECNSKKRAGEPTTSNRYEAWYPQD